MGTQGTRHLLPPQVSYHTPIMNAKPIQLDRESLSSSKRAGDPSSSHYVRQGLAALSTVLLALLAWLHFSASASPLLAPGFLTTQHCAEEGVHGL